MSTTFDRPVKLQQTAATRSIASLLARQWNAFWARRQRASIQAALSDMSNRELQDIGIARGEIDYVALNTLTDPRFIDEPCPRAR